MNTLQTNIVKNYLALRRMENAISRVATDYCNGKIHSYHPFYRHRFELSESGIEELEKDAIKRIRKILGDDLHPIINWDPRGYALKLPHEESDGIHQDWGGYGCIGAEMDTTAVKAIDALEQIRAIIARDEFLRDTCRPHIESIFEFIRERQKHG